LEINSSKLNFTNIETNKFLWIKKFGSFVADSNYKYLLVGNFYDIASTSYSQVANYPNSNYAYYFFDDFCLSTDSTLAFNYNYNCSTPTNIFQQDKSKSELKIYPQPASQVINLENTIKILKVEIVNNIGNSLKTHFNNSNKITFDISAFEDGLYVLKISLENETEIMTKLIINQK
jgi:hypothetical protein